VRETVQAVEAAGVEGGISRARLAQALNVDKSVASRRWLAARAGGYLKNLEDKRGKPARIVLADPLPDDVEVLPATSAVVQAVQRGSAAPLPLLRRGEGEA